MKVYARLHSYYSMLRAVASPKDLVSALHQAGYQAAVLTDYLSLTGAVSFYQACQENQIQPIMGVNFPVTIGLPEQLKAPVQMQAEVVQGNLALLVKNQMGWKNLCQMLSLVQFARNAQQPIHYAEMLEKHAEGLICLTGGMEGPLFGLMRDGNLDVAEGLLSQLQQTYGANLFFELHNQAPYANELLERQIKFARRQGVPVLASHIQWILQPEQAALIPTLHAIRLNTHVDHIPPYSLREEDTAFLSPDQFEKRFANISEAIQNWQQVIEQCDFQLITGETYFPSFAASAGKTAFDVLEEKANLGLKSKYEKIDQPLQDRLDYELQIIRKRGYESIFLIVQELLEYARREGILTSSRGSAASSLVAYCLSITTPDPIKERLYFERFLNPARSSPPDIDTDICSRGREKLIAYIFETYKANHVAVVGTVNRLQPRSAVASVAKAFGCSTEKIRQLSKRLPRRFMAHLQGRSGSWRNIFESELQHANTPLEKKIFQQAMQLVDMPDHLSQHAGGVVITPFPVAEWVPVQPSGSKNITITQFDHHDVETMGLVKMDMLGIRGLTVLGDVATALYNWRRLEFDSSLAVLDEIPLQDEAVADVINNGDTIGCFQIESPGMRSTLKEIGCRSIEGIMQALALYRPGPLQGGLHQSFIRRYRGQEAVVDIHPALNDILADSYGVILYQEQVLRIAHEIGGLSLAEADILRRAMSHFDPGKVMQTLKEKFINGVAQRHQIQADLADEIWQMMSAFAGYGFPKAHAASYARVAWWSAWCKTNHPAEFLCAVLANWGGYYAQHVYVNEARRKGIPIQGPDLHASGREFVTRYPQGEAHLYMGFNQIQRLTKRTIKKIMSKRPFSSFEDFLMKVNPSQQEADNLIQVGACNKFGNIPGLLDQMKNKVRKQQQYGFLLESTHELADWTLQQKAAAQEKLLGINMVCHPLELVREEAQHIGAVDISTAKANKTSSHKLAVTRQTWRRTRSQKKEMMAFVTLEDETDMQDAVMFPQAFLRYQFIVSGQEPFWVEGKFDMDKTRGEEIFLIEKAGKFLGFVN
ncbi:MAG: DNA polymerase III subunit alpha [Anaerolineaceae bacterium]|nr:DNA polymerase III subunit alpha [Anaerolineaceae bacterium]